MESAYPYAVVHSTPPQVYFAEDVETLSEILARRVIARTRSRFFEPTPLHDIRTALLDRNWERALLLWMTHMETHIDIYPSGEIHTGEMLAKEPYDLAIRNSPIFESPDAFD